MTDDLLSQPDSGPQGVQAGENVQRYQAIEVKGAGGQPLAMLLLYQDTNAERTVRILAPASAMQAFIQYQRLRSGTQPRVEDLLACLAQAEIKHGIDLESVRFLAALLHGGEQVGIWQVAQGTPPDHGSDGYLDFCIQPSGREARYDEDEEGRIDFRDLHIIHNVRQGDHIATLRPPTAGKPGKDIFGREVPAIDGKALQVHCGQGVRSDAEQIRFFATHDGRLVYENNLLAVSDIFEVMGDVDYSVGHIDFIGSVIVRGAVLDDFNVCGQRGVTVHGLVGRCFIRSEGDVIMESGMAGRGGGRILAGGKVRAKYLNETLVEAGGDVEVQREIINCVVRTNGRLSIAGGAIIGGECMALGGIEAGSIGSDLGVMTHVISGLEWTAESRLKKIDEEIVRLERRLREIDAIVEPLIQSKDRLAALLPEHRQLLREFLQRVHQMREDLRLLQEERVAIEARNPRNRVSQINVNTLVHPGVVVRFGRLCASIRHPYRGPLSIIEDLERDAVRLVVQVPLLPDEDANRPWTGGLKEVAIL